MSHPSDSATWCVCLLLLAAAVFASVSVAADDDLQGEIELIKAWLADPGGPVSADELIATIESLRQHRAVFATLQQDLSKELDKLHFARSDGGSDQRALRDRLMQRHIAVLQLTDDPEDDELIRWISGEPSQPTLRDAVAPGAHLLTSFEQRVSQHKASIARLRQRCAQAVDLDRQIRRGPGSDNLKTQELLRIEQQVDYRSLEATMEVRYLKSVCEQGSAHASAAKEIVNELESSIKHVETVLDGAVEGASLCTSDDEARRLERVISNLTAEVAVLEVRSKAARRQLEDARARADQARQRRSRVRDCGLLLDRARNLVRSINEESASHSSLRTQLETLQGTISRLRTEVPAPSDLSHEMEIWLARCRLEPSLSERIRREYRFIDEEYRAARTDAEAIESLQNRSMERDQSLSTATASFDQILKKCLDMGTLEIAECPVDPALERRVVEVEKRISSVSTGIRAAQRSIIMLQTPIAATPTSVPSVTSQPEGRPVPQPTPREQQVEPRGIEILGPGTVNSGQRVGFVAVDSERQVQARVEWQSSDDSVLTISPGGVATGVYRGTAERPTARATVVATSDGDRAFLDVTVMDLDAVSRAVVDRVSRGASGDEVIVRERSLQDSGTPSDGRAGSPSLVVEGSGGDSRDDVAPTTGSGGWVSTGSTTSGWSDSGDVVDDARLLGISPSDDDRSFEDDRQSADVDQQALCAQLVAQFEGYVATNPQLAQSVALQAQVAGCPMAAQMTSAANQRTASAERRERDVTREQTLQLLQSIQTFTEQVRRDQQQRQMVRRQAQLDSLERNRVGSSEDTWAMPKPDRTIGWLNTTPQDQFNPSAGSENDASGSETSGVGGGAGGQSEAQCRQRLCPMCEDTLVMLDIANEDEECQNCLDSNAAQMRQCMSGSGDSGSSGGAGGGDSGIWTSPWSGGTAPMGDRCFVGVSWDDQPRYAVACDGASASASVALSRGGFHTIAYGPATFEQCQRWLRDRGVPRW